MEGQEKHSDEILGKLHKLVLDNLGNENFGAKTLAEISGIDPDVLRKLVNQETGKSLTRYIREIRLVKARELLNEEGVTAAEIAFRVGFKSPTYFNRSYKQYYGYPPGESRLRNEQPQRPSRSKLRTSYYSFSGALLLVSAIVLAGIIALTLYWLNHQNTVPPPQQEKALSILPFENLNNNPDHEYLILGIQDELQVYLSGLQGVKVIARLASEQYKDSPLSLREIGHRLNVTHLITGSFQFKENKIRVVVQLVEAGSGAQLWTKSFDRELTDIFEVQTDIAKNVASALDTRLGESSDKIESGRATANPEAYKAYIRGRDLWKRRGEDNLWESLYFFEKAIALDPDYALAYSGLADAYAMLAWYDIIFPEEGYSRSLELVETSLQMEFNNPEPHATKGVINTYYLRQWDKAKEEFELALELNSGYDAALAWYSELLHILGEYQEGFETLEKAIELNPGNTVFLSLLLSSHYDTGNYREAIQTVDIVEHLGTNPWWGHMRIKSMANLMMIDSLRQLLKQEEIALPQRGNLATLEDSISFRNNLVYSYAEWLDDGNGESWNYNEFDKATLYAITSDTLKVLEALEKMYSNNRGRMLTVNSLQGFDLVREHPRFQALLDSLNLK